MSKPKITLEEALELVEFEQADDGYWIVVSVRGDVYGDVGGSVRGSVRNVYGSVRCNVGGSVGGTINGKPWQFIETPREKLKRLIEAGADKDQLLEALNQMEDNS